MESINRFWQYCTRYIDGFLLGAISLLMITGLIVLYSASGGNFSRVSSQFVNMLIAVFIMWSIANIPLQQLMRLALPLYFIGIILLIAVALFGEVQNGARRWLNIGITRIQPSELLKIAVPLMMAWYFEKTEIKLRLRAYAGGALILILPILLIARQPDLGTAILISASGFYVLYFAGLSWRVMGSLAVIAAAAIPLFWSLGMRDYQRKRVLTMLDPSQDALGAGYHIIQSNIAIGSGGITGKGWQNGTQSQLDFLPEQSTDFIFAVF